jgi:hypothetical protein
MKILKASIKPTGEMTVETVSGFAGSACAATLDQIEIAIGRGADSEEKKKEYYLPPADVLLNLSR